MPKVAKDYALGKIDGFMDSLLQLSKEKPMYLVTMKDVIRKSGVSQGGIYYYFKDIDELLTVYINKFFRQRDNKEKVELIFNIKDNDKKVIYLMCKLIASNLKFERESFGKGIYEARIMYNSAPSRYAAVKEKLTEDLLNEHFLTLLADFIRKSKASSTLDVDVVMMHVTCIYEGIYKKCMDTEADSRFNSILNEQIDMMFTTLCYYLKL